MRHLLKRNFHFSLCYDVIFLMITLKRNFDTLQCNYRYSLYYTLVSVTV